MAAVANVQIEIGVRNALGALKSLDTAVQGVGNRISAVGRSMQGLAGIAATVGAGAAVSGFLRAGIEADRTSKKIQALAGQYKETSQLNALANKAAAEFGIGQTKAANAVSDLYGRLRPMGISLKDIGTTFTGVNKAAALMNLSSDQLSSVMLQLSQAMGSGRLQGDELRSIMEQLPMVGQAVAKVMKVDVSQIKQLGEQGKITTDVMIQALAELNKAKAPPPDTYKLFQKAIEDLNTAIGKQLLPVFQPLIQKLTELVAKFQQLGVGTSIANALLPLGQILLGLVDAFMRLNPGIQQFIIQVTAIAGVLALIIVPLGIFLSTLGAVITAITSVVGVLSGLSIFATVAGWLGALVPALTAVIALLMGPAGLVIAIGAVVAALIAFREPIANFISQAIQGFTGLLQFLTQQFIQPVIQGFGRMLANIQSIFNGIINALTVPFRTAASIIRGIVNGIIGGIQNAINGAINGLNRLIAGANAALSRLRMPTIPFVPTVSIPAFAQGGMVTGPTLALVGEAGPEYIVPQSKAAGFAQNYISGKRGASAVPAFADGGFVGSMPSINIQTGPVIEQNGQRYVSMADLERAMQTMASSILGNVRTNSGRRYVGVG